jgi:hypothetical protein
MCNLIGLIHPLGVIGVAIGLADKVNQNTGFLSRKKADVNFSLVCPWHCLNGLGIH